VFTLLVRVLPEELGEPVEGLIIPVEEGALKISNIINLKTQSSKLIILTSCSS